MSDTTANGLGTRKRGRLIPSFLTRPLFLWTVLIPNVASIGYFGFVATPIYRSTATIMVSSPKGSESTSLSSMLSGVGDSTHDGSYLLKSHIGSWDAFEAVAGRLHIADHYASADPIDRFGGAWSGFDNSDTALWGYYQRMVRADVDDKSGIVTLEADGYSAAFVQQMASSLLTESVQHMDRMNDQQAADHLRDSAARKTALEHAVAQDEAAIAEFRTRVGVYDPKERYASDLALATSLEGKEADLDAQRAATAAATPDNPGAPALGKAISAVHSRESVANHSLPELARDSAEYEQLTIKRDNDVALLTQATLAAQQADLNAAQNRYYLAVVSAPSHPTTPEMPHRAEWIGLTLAITLLAWSLLR